jgi:CTP synthase
VSNDETTRILTGCDAIVVPGGFGVRGIEGKINALEWSRRTKTPALGLCLGMQCMVVEHARNHANLPDANSMEFNPETPNPVIVVMNGQEPVISGDADMGGTMRLGSYDAVLVGDSVTAAAYKRWGFGFSAREDESITVQERHRHRYEVNPDHCEALSDSGLVLSGRSPDGTLVEFVELPKSVHPFYVGTQAHPEFKSRPTVPHPLFAALVQAALGRSV